VDGMPQAGDPYAKAFIVEPMRCWRMIHDANGPGDGSAHGAIVGGECGRVQNTWTGLRACGGSDEVRSDPLRHLERATKVSAPAPNRASELAQSPGPRAVAR